MAPPLKTPTRWWWVRHAPVAAPAGFISGQLDVVCDLSDDRAFRALAERLPAGARWVTSHLGRAVATAEKLVAAGAAPAGPMQAEPDLAEQDFGQWAGLTWDDLGARAEVAAFWQAPAETAPPGGESFAQVCARVRRVVERLSAQHAGGDVVAVAHAGAIRAALAHARGVSAAAALAFEVANLSLSRIDHPARPPAANPLTPRHWP